MPKRREAIRHQVRLLMLGCGEDEFAQRLGDHRGDLGEIHRLGTVLDTLVDQIPDIAVQAVGHQLAPSSPNIKARRRFRQRGFWFAPFLPPKGLNGDGGATASRGGRIWCAPRAAPRSCYWAG